MEVLVYTVYIFPKDVVLRGEVLFDSPMNLLHFITRDVLCTEVDSEASLMETIPLMHPVCRTRDPTIEALFSELEIDLYNHYRDSLRFAKSNPIVCSTYGHYGVGGLGGRGRS